MEKKNKKLIILVSILLVGIGVSLAYFVGTSMFGGVGSKVEGVASSINGATLNVEGILEFNDLDILPGHQTISSVKVTATGNNELIPYNLIWKGTNTLNTPLNYRVYKTTERKEVSITCEKKTKIENGAQILNEECTTKNVEQLGSIIARGTINKVETKVTLAREEFITATSDGATIYYYVILEYPNLEEEQNEDMGGTFNGQVTVEESNAKPDINILAVKIEQEDGTYKDSQDIPQEGYALNTEKSVCSNGANPGWDIVNKRFYADNLTKSGTSCYLYFNKQCGKACKSILANVAINEGTPNFGKTSCSSGCGAETTVGLYKATDDDGDTYYFRGDVENNYIKFADKYWRIIRINGDGSIRLIYDGTSVHANGESTNDSIAKENVQFNININDNAYVGFKYTIGKVHGLDIKSNILSQLEIWYNDNLSAFSTSLNKNAGFCGDRTFNTATLSNLGGIGTTETHYGSNIRLSANNEKMPNLQCVAEDLYTVNSSYKGNESLEYPIGLITADEVSMAGGLIGVQNYKYYLNNGQAYWLLSPSLFNSSPYVYGIDKNGRIDHWAVHNSRGIRPVINLRSDIEITGTGTMNDPYIVVEEE